MDMTLDSTTDSHAVAVPVDSLPLNDLSPAPNSQLDVIDEYPRGLRLIAITAALILSIFLSALDSTIIATLIPAITTHFGSLAQVGWYSSTYPLLNASFLTFWGKAYTLFPLKRVFVSAVAIFQLGNVLCGAAPKSSVLILGRAIAGIGGAGVASGSFIIIAYTARPEQRPTFMSLLGFTFAVASVAGPLLGGALVDNLSWRWGFWINLPTGFVAVSIMLLAFQPPRAAVPRPARWTTKIRHMDLAGTAVVLASTTSFVQAMHYLGAADGRSDKTAIGLIACSTVLMFVFFLIERQMAEYAMLPLHYFSRPRFVQNLIFIFFFAGLYFSLLFALPIQFQSVDNVDASSSGLRIIPLVLGVSIFTIVSNYLLQRYHQNTTLLVTGAVIGAIGGFLIYGLHTADRTALWIVFQLVVATGVGFALQLPMIANQASVSASDIPTATSMTLFFETIGQALFTAAGEAAFTSTLARKVAALPDHTNPQTVIAAGATGFRKVFTAQQIPEIVSSYSAALRANYLLSAVCGLAAAIVSITMVAPTLKLRFLTVADD